MEYIINDSILSDEDFKFIEIICLSEEVKKQLEKDPLINYTSIIRLKSESNFTLDPWHLESYDRKILIIVSDKICNLNADALNILEKQQEEGRCVLFIRPQSQKNYTYAILKDINKIKDFIKSLCIVTHGSYPTPIDFHDIRDIIFYSKREVKLHKMSIIKNSDTLSLWDNMSSLLLNSDNYSSFVAHLWFPNGISMTTISNTWKDFLIGFEQLTQHTDNWVWGFSSGDQGIINAYSGMTGLTSGNDLYNHFPKDEIVLSIFTII